MSESIRNWIQTLALVVAGAWVLYEFVLSEDRRELGLKINTAVEVGTPIAPLFSQRAVSPVSFSIEIENIGDRRGQIILAYVIIHGRVFSDGEDLQPPQFDPAMNMDVINVRDVNWTSDVSELAYAFILPSFTIVSNETIVATPNLLIAEPDKFDLFTYDIVVWAAESCSGVYPMEACSSFQLEVTGWQDDACNGEPLNLGLCGQFYRSDAGSGAAVPVRFDTLIDTNNAYVLESSGFFTVGDGG